MRVIAGSAALFVALTQPLCAQEMATKAALTAGISKPAILISLNALDTTTNGCKLTFLVEHLLPLIIGSLQTEVSLFNLEGVVGRLTMLDFQSLPARKKRGRQFGLAGGGCGQISGLLLNDINIFDAGEIDCMTAYKRLKRSAFHLTG